MEIVTSGLPLHPILKNNIKRWDEKNRQAGRRDHAGENGDPEASAGVGAGASREHERKDPKNERERSHDDRSKAKTGGFNGGINYAFPGSAIFPRHLDNENGVLCRKRDGENGAELNVHVVPETGAEQSVNGAQRRRRQWKGDSSRE